MESNATYVRTPDGVRLFVQTAGTGANAVVVPNAIYMFDDFKRLAANHTLISFDLRNRGLSDAVEDPALLAGGVQNDVDDIETIRKHFGLEKFALIGHSYVGLVVALYAMRHPERVGRMIQIGPPQPVFGQQYPPELSNSDATLSKVWANLQALYALRQSLDPVEFCRRWWAVAREMYVADPALLDRVGNWGFCDLATERNLMRYFMESITPSLQRLNLTPEDFARVTCPVLTIHGTKDRNSPYGAGVDWSKKLPNARLLTVEGAAHVPWIEAPELVWQEIESFLAGAG